MSDQLPPREEKKILQQMRENAENGWDYDFNKLVIVYRRSLSAAGLKEVERLEDVLACHRVHLMGYNPDPQEDRERLEDSALLGEPDFYDNPRGHKIICVTREFDARKKPGLYHADVQRRGRFTTVFEYGPGPFKTVEAARRVEWVRP